MSIRFVIGRSGTGKTTLFLDEIRDRLEEQPDGPPVLYIVPEQMTFQSEYRFNQYTRGRWDDPALKCIVLPDWHGVSFRRQVERVAPMSSNSGLSMLIRKIIEDNKEDLKLFRRAADKAGFIQHVEAMLTEFKHYCVEPEDLIQKRKELAVGASTRVLADKLHDLELIYTSLKVHLRESTSMQMII